jgi:hypothetical protein
LERSGGRRRTEYKARNQKRLAKAFLPQKLGARTEGVVAMKVAMREQTTLGRGLAVYLNMRGEATH